MLVAVAAATLAGIVACKGPQKPRPWDADYPKPAQNGATELVALTAAGDPAAILPHLLQPLPFGGMWFPDQTCRRQFGVAGRIPKTGIEAFARCLAMVKLVKSEREHPYPDFALVTYEPGIEIEVGFAEIDGATRVSWIGYAGRRDTADALPTISQRVFEAHRTSPGTITIDAETHRRIGEELAGYRRHFKQSPSDWVGALAWFKVCLDASGTVTGVHQRSTSSIVAVRAFADAIRTWTFKPVVLDGQPTPVCALVAAGYPAGPDGPDAEDLRLVPHPVPQRHARSLIVPPGAFGTLLAGSKFVVPDDDRKMWMKRNRVSELALTLVACIDRTGAVDSAMVGISSGMPDYDARIRQHVRQWRYPPFLVDGKPTPACEYVKLVYRQH